MTDRLPTSPVHAADEAGAEWRRLHPAYILTGLVRNLRGLLFPLVFIFFSRGFEGDLIFYASSAVIALGAGLFSFVGWLFFATR